MERQQLIMFYDNSRTKIGLQYLANKASSVSRHVKFDWFYQSLSPDALRVKLKHALFKYPSSAVSYSVPGDLRKQIWKNRTNQLRSNDYRGRMSNEEDEELKKMSLLRLT